MDWEGVNEGGERTWPGQIKLHGSVLSCQPADREASAVHLCEQIIMFRLYGSTTTTQSDHVMVTLNAVPDKFMTVSK